MTVIPSKASEKACVHVHGIACRTKRCQHEDAPCLGFQLIEMQRASRLEEVQGNVATLVQTIDPKQKPKAKAIKRRLRQLLIQSRSFGSSSSLEWKGHQQRQSHEARCMPGDIAFHWSRWRHEVLAITEL